MTMRSKDEARGNLRSVLKEMLAKVESGQRPTMSSVEYVENIVMSYDDLPERSEGV